jgi:hypothetical protein
LQLMDPLDIVALRNRIDDLDSCQHLQTPAAQASTAVRQLGGCTDSSPDKRLGSVVLVEGPPLDRIQFRRTTELVGVDLDRKRRMRLRAA